MPNPIRMKRISDRIREDLAEMLVREVADPRLAGVMITDVKVDRELAFADVYVSAVEGQERSQVILQVLRHAGGFMRSTLAKRIELRTFPRLRFHWDPTPERAERIERILNEIHSEDTDSGNPDSAPEANPAPGAAQAGESDPASFEEPENDR
jgi:ribosome-binding factor A